MTKDLYDKILSLPKDKRDRSGLSSLVTRLTSDTYQIQVGINQFCVFEGNPSLPLVLSSYLLPSCPKLTLCSWGWYTTFDYCDHVDCQPLACYDSNITDRMVTTRQQFLKGMRVIRALDKQASEDFEVNQHHKIWQQGYLV